MDLRNKRIVLTGASSGIGKELLQLLVTYTGVQVVAVARNIEPILQSEQVVFPFAADVSQAEGVDAVFAYAKEVMGGIDIFVANAGFAYTERLIEADWKHTERIFQLNVFSPIYTLEKLHLAYPSTQTMIVFVSSAVAFFPLPGYALYCSTKAALHQFAETYRYEKPQSVHLLTVYPVATKTSFFENASGTDTTPLPFLRQEAKTVASRIVRGMKKNKRRVYPSLLFRMSYPIMRAFPFLIRLYSLNEKRKLAHFLQLPSRK